MALNDVADLERDRELAPNRVLPSGKISPRAAVAGALVVLGGSAAAVFAVPVEHPLRLGVWPTLVFLILAYDFFVKQPPVMGLVRAFNFVLGVSCAPFVPFMTGTGNAVAVLGCAFASFVYVTSLTLVSTLEEGMKGRRTLWLGVLGMGLGAALPSCLAILVPGRAPWDTVLGAVVAAFLIGWVAFRASRAAERRGLMILVRDGVEGIALLDASMLIAAGSTGAGAAVAALVLPAILCVAWFKKLA
jgi:4-hydroxybenzoate polyprenyltransferase